MTIDDSGSTALYQARQLTVNGHFLTAEITSYKDLFRSAYEKVSLESLLRCHGIALFRLHMGYSRLNAHLHRLGIMETEMFTSDSASENVRHFVLVLKVHRPNGTNLIE